MRYKVFQVNFYRIVRREKPRLPFESSTSFSDSQGTKL
jgi:hypothetical protein